MDDDEEAEKLIARSSTTTASRLSLRNTTDKSTVSLRTFIITVVAFISALVILGVGLGLTLPRIGAASSSSSSSTTSGGSSSSSNAATYGLPDHLDVITSSDKLVNKTELDLKTGFRHDAESQRRRRGDKNPAAAIRDYEFNVSHAYAAPDGFYKPMILVNGQSPGPLVEAYTGDTIRVRVNNQMSNATTSIHWHGIDQRNSSWMDGVVGVTQCGIPPGESFTYEFSVVDQRGTFWWHAHQSVQYTDGLFGPIVIHDPDELVPEVDDEKIILVGDHYHTYAPIIRDSYLQPGSAWSPDETGVEPLADNILINGQHSYNCSVTSSTYNASSSSSSSSSSITNSITPQPPACKSGSLYTTTVQANQTIRLRLINHSSFLSYWFSIDNHSLSIVEIDGNEIEPISARGVYLNIGQRYSVLLTANQTKGNYFMRATLPQTCFLPYSPYVSAGLQSIDYQARGVISYRDDNEENATAESETPPIGIAGNTTNPYGVENNPVRGDVWEGCDDMPFDLPVRKRREKAVDVVAENTYAISFQFREVGEINRIFINKTSWSPYRDDATLWLAMEQNFTRGNAGSYNNWGFRLDQQVLLLPAANKGVQIAINSMDVMEHPFHMHGHSFQVVGWGPGIFSGSTPQQSHTPGSNSSSNPNTTVSKPSTTTWNLDNPLRRDTITIPAMTHVVLRFEADNPGVWALHCHVAWHMEGGMFVTLLERPDDLKELLTDRLDPAQREGMEKFCAKRRGR